ncbi:TPA: hypothetical protein ACVO0U_003058 [Vibrio alginolyticus]
MEQTALVEDFILPEVGLSDIENYDLIPKVKQWFVCSERNAKKAAQKGLPVVKTHAGNWYGIING